MLLGSKMTSAFEVKAIKSSSRIRDNKTSGNAGHDNNSVVMTCIMPVLRPLAAMRFRATERTRTPYNALVQPAKGKLHPCCLLNAQAIA